MAKPNLHKQTIISSLIITAIIFSLAIITSYTLDFVRMDQIVTTINEYKVGTEYYLAEKEFLEVFGGNKCNIMESRAEMLKKDIEDIGQDLSKYSQKSFFNKKNYDYLKRKYFLLELKLYNWMNDLNDNCDQVFSTVLFFYQIDDDVSERQGYILTELTKKYPNKILVFSFDKDYTDEPLLDIIKLRYNITKAPTMIINNEIKLEELNYLVEIESLIKPDIAIVDKYAKTYDFTFTLNATHTDTQNYISKIEDQLKQDISDFAKADLYLILGRLLNNDNVICQSTEFYLNIPEENKEEKALAEETLASLNCDKKQKHHYLNAAELWKEIGNYFRADIDERLANDEELNVYYNIEDLPEPEQLNRTWEYIVIGSSSFVIDDKDIIVSQSDRVTRDWLSNQISQSPYGKDILTIFSEKDTLPESELLPEIGWHEGARIKELTQTGAKHIVASGTLVKKIDDKWYAPDETGIFRFEVPIDKLLYPTTRFLKEDLAVVIDTHGINMLVEQAVRNKATVVIGCGDHPGKIKAAKYLSDKGIKVIMFPDKYASLALNQRAMIYPSPPIERKSVSFVIGGRPVTIQKDDVIIVMNASSEKFALSYYQTPTIYFENLKKIIDIDPIYAEVTDFNQMHQVIKIAEKQDADIIAVRVYNRYDYNYVSEWLEENPEKKAILFHSMPYPFGYKLLKEFPEQATFGDINPIIS